jgi:hypothetical protein
MDKMLLKIDGSSVSLIAVRSARLIAIRQPKILLRSGCGFPEGLDQIHHLFTCRSSTRKRHLLYLQ